MTSPNSARGSSTSTSRTCAASRTPQGHTLEVDGRYYVHVPLGEGDVRNGETLRQLAAVGYTGWIANESECSWPDWDTSVSAARHEYAELDKLIQATPMRESVTRATPRSQPPPESN